MSVCRRFYIVLTISRSGLHCFDTELAKVFDMTGGPSRGATFQTARSEKGEGVSMTLVALGLLSGMVGRVWVMVIDIMQADQ